jgi:hypothetical protein
LILQRTIRQRLLVRFDAECRETICGTKLIYPPRTNPRSSLEQPKPLATQLGFDDIVEAATIGEDGARRIKRLPEEIRGLVWSAIEQGMQTRASTSSAVRILYTVIAIDRRTREWSVAQRLRQNDAATAAYELLYE